MLFMQFKLGPDMAICLIKAIAFALLSAFLVMPGLLMLFGPLIEKTGHRSFVPKIPFVGHIDYATRFFGAGGVRGADRVCLPAFLAVPPTLTAYSILSTPRS